MSRAAELLSLFRLRAFDNETEGGRSRERYRLAGFTAVAAVLAKIVGIIAVFVTVPLTLNYLGTERYGLWMTLSSISLLLGFADFGIANGILNVVAEAHGRDDRTLGRQAVSSGFLLMSAIAVALVAVFALVYTFVPWARVYNVSSSQAMLEAGPATAVFFLVWAVNIPLGVVQRVQLGYQRGFVSYAWQAAGSMFALAGAVVAIQAEAGLPWLVLALAGGPLAAAALNNLVEFGWARRWLRPAWSFATRGLSRRILRLGGWFFVIQLAFTIGYSSDYFIIAQVLGSPDVTEYGVPAKLFASIGVLLAMLLMPLWPAYGEAMTRGDVPWIKRTLVRTLVLTTVLVATPATILVVFGRPIIEFWVGDAVDPSYWLLAGLALWALMSGLGATVSVFLNGLNVLRFQAVCLSLMAVSAMVLKVVFARRWGVVGVPWAMVAAYGVFVAAPTLAYVPGVFRRLGGAEDEARD